MTEHGAARPRVSVVIPCFNGERFIRGSLDSVLGQTLDDLDVIVVDDGSTDDSVRVAEGYSGDGRVRLLRHSFNRGIPAARNTGVRSASAQYVAFLDQDDRWASDKLELQVAMLDAAPPGVGMVFSDVLMVDEEGRSWGLAQAEHMPRGVDALSKEGLLRAYFLHNFIALISVLVRRECFDEVGLFDESIGGGMDDYEFCLRMVGRYAVRYVDRPLAQHTVHPGSFSRDTERLISDAPRIADRTVRKFPFLSDLVPRRLAIHHYRLAKHYRDAGEAARAKWALRKAIEYDPRWCTLYLQYLLCLTGRLGRELIRARRRLRRLARREQGRRPAQRLGRSR